VGLVESALDGGRRHVPPARTECPLSARCVGGGVMDQEFYSGFAQLVHDLAEKADPFTGSA